jgi:CHAT domain-containing protein
MNRTSGAVFVSGFTLVVVVGLANAWLLSSREDDLRADLAAAVGSSLPFDARLSGGFLPSDRSHTVRSTATTAAALSPDARIAVAQLEKRALAAGTPRAAADLGVAYLIQGDVDRAISTLADAAVQLNHAAPWNDLAVAYLAKADRAATRQVEYLSRGLEAAAQSLRIAPSNEAVFNSALARHRLMPFVGEPAPWQEILRHEKDQRWVDAAQRLSARGQSFDSGRKDWETRSRELQDRLERRDERFILETAERFPEATMDAFVQLLVDWSHAELEANRQKAHAVIAKARLVADAIASATDDRLASDAVAGLGDGRVVLARAHLNYAEGLRQYSSGDYQRANDSFVAARAGFIASRSVCAHLAEAQLAMVVFQQRQLDEADRMLAALVTMAQARRYFTLLGRALWLRGLVYTKAWRLPEALGAFQQAAVIFERAGEWDYAVSVYSLTADALRSLGEHHSSWEHIGKTLAGLEHVMIPVRRYLIFYNASLFASNQHLHEAALLFQNAAVRESASAGPFAVVEALTQRAGIRLRSGERTAAQTDLRSAERSLSEIPDGPLRRYADAEVGVLSAQLRDDPSDPRSLARLSEAIAFFSNFEPARAPKLYLTLARIHASDGSTSAAEAALADGISRLEQQQRTLSDEALKISYFDESWTLFQDMVAVQLKARHNVSKAFYYAERSRARALLSLDEDARFSGIQAPADVQPLLAEHALLIYYATLPDRVVIWTVSRRNVQFTETLVPASELQRLVSRHRTALIDKRDSAENRRLYDLLISPIADALIANVTVVIAADSVLQQLSFATLRNPRTNRYLIQDRAVLMAPSARFLAAARARLTRMTAPARSALLIGNPATAAAALPGSEAEVTVAAKFYDQHAVWTGQNASKHAFIKAAPEFDVVHFGGHGYANAEYPLLSRLAFSTLSGEEDGSLFAHEISRLRFTRTRVVVLAACRTGDGAVSLGEGVVSIARPFLAAGVPLVIASQWDLDDDVTQQFMLVFHRLFSETQDPVGALRQAQLAFLNSNDDVLASPGAWGGFVALGAM